MKVRSKALYQYLLASGALEGTPEAIGMAKLAYRKQYKKLWRQNKRPRKELRIGVTLKQFQGIKMRAREYNLSHTSYARQVLLASVEADGYFIPYRDKLEKVLQLVSMAAIAATRQTIVTNDLSDWLSQAETELLHYLQSNN
jgi:hypothetical protein